MATPSRSNPKRGCAREISHVMYIVAIGWMFVVVCMAAAEAATSSVLGAITTLLCYGILPLALFLWLAGTPERRRRRERAARDDASQ